LEFWRDELEAFARAYHLPPTFVHQAVVVVAKGLLPNSRN
jgi:hypothetical protein